MELPIVVADLVVGELLVLSTTSGVEAARVPRHGHAAVFETERAPLVDEEVETEAEGRRDGHATCHGEVVHARIRGSARAVLAFGHADDRGTREEVQVR